MLKKDKKQQEAAVEETEEKEMVDEQSTDSVEEKEQVNYEELYNKKQKEAADNLDRLQRTMAEFDNFRKRTQKEKSMMYENGAKETLEAILPVIDNFERALNSSSEEDKENAVYKGVEMIYKQLTSALENLGVKAIEAVGNKFDPNFHNAVTHAEDEEFGENEVAEEFQKGYMYNESVLRYSMVKVVN